MDESECTISVRVLTFPFPATEDYIWAMRSSLRQESDSELWKERRATPLAESSQSAVYKRGKRMKNVIPTTDDHNVKVMASLVPDEIIYNVNDYSIRCYDACLLFGDVSGIGLQGLSWWLKV